MDPSETDPHPRKEREETDASLLKERTHTDAELAKTASAADADADSVVELARERAEAVLEAARERVDRDMSAAKIPAEVRNEVEVERAVQDGAIAEERAVADGQLQIERAERKQALGVLLRLEREATDEGLLVERARADEVVSTRDDFLGMVSHDLRTMLGTISLTAEMLSKSAAKQGAGGATTMAHAERIHRSATRMNRLVSDLLDVVSLEAGSLHISPRPIDSCQLVKDVAEAFHPTFVAQGIALSTDTPPGTLLVMCDHERIFQVLANLLSNAVKFTEHGGQVALSVSQAGPDVRLSVTDTGVGIPADKATAIFERFRQVSTKDRRGLGLGLYIAKSIVDAHGGSIWTESPSGQGQGATFHVRLPMKGPELIQTPQ
jgi:signal transduction histidine kinase